MDGRFRWITFDEAIETGDVISLHCPPAENGGPVISREVLERLKEGCCLVNTARASLVDESAVSDSLENASFGRMRPMYSNPNRRGLDHLC